MAMAHRRVLFAMWMTLSKGFIAYYFRMNICRSILVIRPKPPFCSLPKSLIAWLETAPAWIINPINALATILSAAARISRVPALCLTGNQKWTWRRVCLERLTTLKISWLRNEQYHYCLLYTSDAADEED